MQCTKCGFDNPDDAKFCQKCTNVFASSNQFNKPEIKTTPQQEQTEEAQNLDHSPNIPHEQPKPKKRSKFVSWLITIGVFIGFIILANIIFPIVFGSISLNKMGSKSRDARRVSEIKMLQQSLELYYDDVKQYPEKITYGGSLDYNGVTYMPTVPQNPTPNDGKCPNDFEYQYKLTSNGQSYELTYCLGTDYKEERGYHTVNPPSHASNNSNQPDDVKFNFDDIDSNQYSEQRLAECFIDLGIISSADQLDVLSEDMKQKNWKDCLSLQKKTQENELDIDNDGLGYDQEVNIYRTDPNNPDTDGDGYSDGDEVKNGYDPLKP